MIIYACFRKGYSQFIDVARRATTEAVIQILAEDAGTAAAPVLPCHGRQAGLVCLRGRKWEPPSHACATTVAKWRRPPTQARRENRMGERVLDALLRVHRRNNMPRYCRRWGF